MPELDVAFFAFSLAFGALMGYGLGRRSEDRTAGISACLVTAAVGALAWLIGSAGTQPQMAGAAMTVGGLSALGVVVAGGRRVTG